MGERIGVFGGTFDPIHVGHLVTAVNVRHALALDRVLLVVANRPWQKAADITPAAERLRLVQAAVGELEGIEASALEIERGGTSYTADTLRQLQEQQEGCELYLVLGSDAAAGLTTWEHVAQVRERATLVVVTRPGAEDEGPPGGWSCERVVVPRLEVSSTDLRARFADGRPLDYLVPEPVIRVIRRRGLYAGRG